MDFNNNGVLDEKDKSPKQEDIHKPNAWRVEDDNNLKEANLERRLFTDTGKKPVREGMAMGGQNFEKNNVTPAADDKNNPSQNAGYSNPNFARTEPLEEHPEDNNFKAPDQAGRPDYSKAQPHVKNETPKPEKVERGNGENDRPHKGGSYQEGTVDNENEPNIAGPNEDPDQQKVGEKGNEDPFEREHIET